MKHNYAIGVDIGGSHITCAAVNLGSGEILGKTLAERRVNNHAQAFEIIGIWSGCLSDVIKRIGFDDLRGIGFAMPGPFDFVNGVSYIKGVKRFENLYGFNIGDAILSSIEAPESFGIRFIKDSTACAVGEARAGNAINQSKSVCLTLGTGLGSSFIENRIPVLDGPDVPPKGCLSHLPYGGRAAGDYFSTRWLLEAYKEQTGTEVQGFRELCLLAGREEGVKNLFEKFGNSLALFLVPWLKKFGAGMLVAGGTISDAYNLFGPVFEKTLKSEGWAGEVSVSGLKEHAAIIGSSYLFDDEFWNSVKPLLPLM